MQVSRWCAVALSCAVAGLGLSACGDDDDDAGGGGTASVAATTTAAADDDATASGLSPETIDYGVQYIGGTAGKADESLEPVTWGFIDENGGTPSFPEHAAAADAAVQFVNEQLGGIQGHPLKLEKCTILSEEDGQKCGAQMRSANVPVINLSLAVIGNASLYKTVSPTIPVLSSVTPTASDTNTKGAYSFNGAGNAVIYAMAKDAQDQGAKNMALVSVGNPGGKFTMEKIAVPALDKLGVKHGKTVYYADDATTPDIVSALQAAGGSKADYVFFDPSTPQQCVSLWDAMKQLGISVPVVATPICNADIFVGHTGAGPDKWRFWGFATNPRVVDDPQIKVYLEIMKEYGQEKFINTGFADITTSDILNLAKFSNEIGPDKLTAKAFHTAIQEFRGPVYLIPGTPNCVDPPIAATPSICGNESIGSTFEGGSWKSIPSIKVSTS